MGYVPHFCWRFIIRLWRRVQIPNLISWIHSSCWFFILFFSYWKSPNWEICTHASTTSMHSIQHGFRRIQGVYVMAFSKASGVDISILCFLHLFHVLSYSVLSFLAAFISPWRIVTSHTEEREYMGQKETGFATLLSCSQGRRFLPLLSWYTSHCKGQESVNKSSDSSDGKFQGFKKWFPGISCLFCVSNMHN